MLVFEYFYEKMESVFVRLIKKRAKEDYNDRFAVSSDNEV